MIAIVGHSRSGKTTLAKELEKHGYKRRIEWTTRPMRPGEENGIDYIFTDRRTFLLKFANDEFKAVSAFNAQFGFCLYGIHKDDITDDSFIVTNPVALAELRNEFDPFVVHLDLSRNVLTKRALYDFADLSEFNRRFDKDDIMFYDIGADVVVKIAAHPTKIVRRIIKAKNSQE